MQAVVDDRDWATRAVTDGKPVKTYRARDLMRKIAEAAWQCGDPASSTTHRQQVAYVQSHGAHPLLEPVQRVHVPG